MPKNVIAFISATGEVVTLPMTQLESLTTNGAMVQCQTRGGKIVSFGPFASNEHAQQVMDDLISAFDRMMDDRDTPTTKAEYLQAICEDPWRFPCVGGECEPPPVEWIAAAWDLEAVQSNLVDGGYVRDVGKGLPLCGEGGLKYLADALSAEQVLAFFLSLRRSQPHREDEYRPAFEREFARHAAILPPPLTPEEAREALGIGNPADDDDFVTGDEIPF